MSLVDLRPQNQRRSPQELVEHLQSFELDLKFSAGVWFFAPGGSRFHDRYVPPMKMAQVLEKAASLKPYGLAGIEAHYPNEINENNLELFQKFTRDTEIRVVTVVPNLFYQSDFEFGSLSSPIDRVRQLAIERTKIALALNKELDTDFAVVWPGIDGYENPFGIDYYSMWDRFETGLAEAMDAVPGVRVAIEPKPYEPRGANIYRNTPDGLLMCADTESHLQNAVNRGLLSEGHTLIDLNPEVGHVLMGGEDLPYAFARIMRQGRLAHTHWNSQPLGNYDQDQNVGVIAPEQGEAALYVLKMYGYRGWFGIDINPERMPVERALINSMDALKMFNDRINRLDHEKVVFSTTHPDLARGYLEALLLRARAVDAGKLSALPELPMQW